MGDCRREPSGDSLVFHDPDDDALLDSSELFDEDEEDDGTEEDFGQDDDSAAGFVTRYRATIYGAVGWLLGRGIVDDTSATLADEHSRRAALHADATALPHPENDVEPGAGRDHGGLQSIQLGASKAATSKTLSGASYTERRVRPFAREEEVVGSFEKRSPWWVDGWRRRDFVLRGSKLLYFEAQRPDRPIGVLDFNLLRYELHCCWAECRKGDEGDAEGGDEKRGAAVAEQLPVRACDAMCSPTEPADCSAFYLRPEAFPTKAFAFRGPSKDVRHLAGVIARCVASGGDPAPPPLAPCALRGLPMPPVSEQNFWRFGFVWESNFLAKAETGDLLLFRGKEFSNALTRAVTRATYDHVGLILRSSDDELLVLEATGSHGVAVVSWSEFRARGWHSCYTRLVWRKVYFARSDAQLDALQAFVHTVYGGDYDLSLDKLFSRTRSRQFDADGRDITLAAMPEDEHDPGPRAFFCSELVAACLKRCGVLAGAKASSQYWPGTFSQHSRESLPLQEGVHVGEELMLLYDD